MTDIPAPASSPREPGFLRLLLDYFLGGSLLARLAILTVLMICLKVPLAMVGGVISDRQAYQSEAVRNVTESWGGPQAFAGPMIVLPYKRGDRATSTLTLLPEKLTIDSEVRPEQRRRGLLAVTVYTATLDVVAEFHIKALREMAEGRAIDWAAARLTLGLTDPKSVDAATADVDGQRIEWLPDNLAELGALQAPLGSSGVSTRETVVVRFRITFGGSGALAFVPLGRRTEVNIASPWPSPSFSGRSLPVTQTVDKDGFRARWTASHLGRRYGQLWDSASATSDPSTKTVLESAFGVSLLNPIDAYRETDRAIKYAIMFIGLTFAACLLFELATGTRPHVAQYGLIGLSLCVFYLLLLSLAEQIGFAAAYIASASAVVVQATIYNWALQRRRGPALAFGAILAGLYGGLYALLQLEEVALLAGSVLLFAVLSLAMWFTRNLHRVRQA